MPEILLPGGVRIGYRVKSKDALDEIRGIQDRLAHMRPFYRVLGNILRSAWRRNFSAGGIPPWKPLAPSTIAEKRDAGFPAPGKSGKPLKRLTQNGNFGPDNILIRTGRMRDALCQMNAPGNITRISDSGAEFGINDNVVPYAAYHEFGGKNWYHIYPVNAKALAFMGSEGYIVYRLHVYHPPLPRRPMTTLQDEDWSAIRRAAIDYVLGITYNGSPQRDNSFSATS